MHAWNRLQAALQNSCGAAWTINVQNPRRRVLHSSQTDSSETRASRIYARTRSWVLQNFVAAIREPFPSSPTLLPSLRTIASTIPPSLALPCLALRNRSADREEARSHAREPVARRARLSTRWPQQLRYILRALGSLDQTHRSPQRALAGLPQNRQPGKEPRPVLMPNNKKGELHRPELI